MKTEVISRGQALWEILKSNIKPLIKTLSNALNNNYYHLNMVDLTYKK